MNSLLFGTAGIPLSTEDRNTINGIKQVSSLKLGAMELEFVQSVNIREEKTEQVKNTAKENNVVLTCHGQYFMNFNAQEPKKMQETKARLYNAARIADMCGAWSVCFHPAFYMKQDKEKVYEIVKNNIKETVNKIKDNGHKIWIRPELTGKGSAFGDLEEIIRLSQDIEQVLPCIDFAHLHARTQKYNTYKEFCSALEQIESKLGRFALDNMHIHIAGIRYSEKGELNHLELKNSDMNYTDLVKAWKTFKIKGVVISESPNIERDALLLKNLHS